MTYPDYHYYLVGTDLRTPEDVAKWLRSLSYFTRERPWRQDIDGACDELDERLDRERRQACRRGALARFKVVAWYGRQVRSGRGDIDDFASEMAWDDAAACLACRAAARQP